jgi:hypothetical protein
MGEEASRREGVRKGNDVAQMIARIEAGCTRLTVGPVLMMAEGPKPW